MTPREPSENQEIRKPANTLGLDALSTHPSSEASLGDVHLPVEFGRYRLLKLLGEGGMGAVYLAHDTELDRKIALKLPHFVGKKSRDLSERFRREARLSANLDHPNICRIFDIGEHDGRLYLTMAYIDGKSLSDVIKARGPVENVTAAKLMKRVATVVEFAHVRGIIHRDLKPANIMIKRDRDFVIMDFGLARRIDQDEPQLTASGAVLGTPAYMAPEQLRGEQNTIGPASDVYSLGIILFELLTGQRPFNGTLPQIYAQALSSGVLTPSAVRQSIDPKLDAICHRATHGNREQRYRSAAELASALEDYLNPVISPVAAPAIILNSNSQINVRKKVESQKRVRKLNSSIVLIVSICCLILITGGIWLMQRDTLKDVTRVQTLPSASTSTRSFPDDFSASATAEATQILSPKETQELSIQAIEQNRNGAEWKSLFDGKSLAGWKASANSEVWRVENNCIVCDGTRSLLFYMAEAQPFVDFDFRCEVKMTPACNSGIYFHTHYQTEPFAKYGLECQISNVPTDQRSGSIYGVVDAKNPPIRDNEWYTQEISVRGKRVVFKINGQLVVDYTEPDNQIAFSNLYERLLGSGTFALQSNSPGRAIYFRNIEVRRIPG